MKTHDTISARVEQDLHKVYEQYVEEAKEYFNKELKRLFEDFPLLSEVSYFCGSFNKASYITKMELPNTNQWGFICSYQKTVENRLNDIQQYIGHQMISKMISNNSTFQREEYTGRI